MEKKKPRGKRRSKLEKMKEENITTKRKGKGNSGKKKGRERYHKGKSKRMEEENGYKSLASIDI